MPWHHLTLSYLTLSESTVQRMYQHAYSCADSYVCPVCLPPLCLLVPLQASGRGHRQCYYVHWFVLQPDSQLSLGMGQQASNRDWDRRLGTGSAYVGVKSCLDVSDLHAALSSILACSTWLRCTSRPIHGMQCQWQLVALRQLC